MQVIGGDEKARAFKIFKMMELYEGKATVDLTQLTELECYYLTKYKEELNQAIEDYKNKQKKKQKGDTRSNIEIHRDHVNRGE